MTGPGLDLTKAFHFDSVAAWSYGTVPRTVPIAARADVAMQRRSIFLFLSEARASAGCAVVAVVAVR